MFDFPSSPSIGATYTPIAGKSTYTWDGEKWGTGGTPAPFADAPTDGRIYGRKNTAWASAAPFDAMQYSSLLMNGGFEVNAWNWVNGVSTQQAVDCWVFAKVGAAGVTASIQAGGPPGFSKYMAITVNAPSAVLGGGDSISLYQNIEGMSLRRLSWGTINALPLSLGFWSCHDTAGLYGGIVSAGDGTTAQACPFAYNQNVGGQWEYKSATIPANPTIAPPFTNDSRATVNFALNSAALAAPLVWGALGVGGPTGMINGAAAAQSFRLAGVFAIPGAESPPAEKSPLLIRPQSEEALRCMRYIRRYESVLVNGYNVTGAPVYNTLQLDPPMRVAPGVSAIGTQSFLNASALVANIITPSIFRLGISIGATGYGYCDAQYINLDARM
jgi:hypothetical protein